MTEKSVQRSGRVKTGCHRPKGLMNMLMEHVCGKEDEMIQSTKGLEIVQESGKCTVKTRKVGSRVQNTSWEGVYEKPPQMLEELSYKGETGQVHFKREE